MMAGIVVTLFIESNSFAEAKCNMAYLEMLQIWDNSYSARLKAAAVENGQISGSYGVTSRLDFATEKVGKSDTLWRL